MSILGVRQKSTGTSSGLREAVGLEIPGVIRDRLGGETCESQVVGGWNEAGAEGGRGFILDSARKPG